MKTAAAIRESANNDTTDDIPLAVAWMEVDDTIPLAVAAVTVAVASSNRRHALSCDNCEHKQEGDHPYCPLCGTRIPVLVPDAATGADHNDGTSQGEQKSSLSPPEQPPTPDGAEWCNGEKKLCSSRAPILHGVNVVGDGRDFARFYEHESKFDCSSLSVTMWVTKKNNSYNWLVSRGEWTEGYSIGILKSGDCGGAIRAAFGSCGHLVGKTRINKNTLYHIGLTFDADSSVACLYVNGVCDQRKDFAGKQIKYHTKIGSKGKIREFKGLWIGGEALGLGTRFHGAKPRHFLHGEICGLTGWDYARSASEIEEEFRRGMPKT